MTWAVILPMLKRAAPYILVAIAVFGVYQLGRSHGKAKWYPKYQEQLNAAREAERQLKGVRRGLALCIEKTADFSAESSARISRLEKALEEKPEVIYKYRDQIVRVDEAIQSEDCETALAEAAAFLSDVEAP